MARCKWVVEFEISDNWIADGFDLSQECVDRMIQARVPFATEDEVKARIKRAPDALDLEIARKRDAKQNGR